MGRARGLLYLSLQAGPGGPAESWGARVRPHGVHRDLATELVILVSLQAAAFRTQEPTAIYGAGEALRAPADPIGRTRRAVGTQEVMASLGDLGGRAGVAEVTLVPSALAASQPVQPRAWQPLEVISVLEVRDALGHNGPRLRPAIVSTPIGPTQGRLALLSWLNELLPASEQLLGPLGELLVLGFLANVVDELPESSLLGAHAVSVGYPTRGCPDWIPWLLDHRGF